MRLGIIGVGHLAEALLKGLARHGAPDVILSPRGKGPALARAMGLDLAADNDALVRKSDAVLLAVRPADAPAALEGLPWRRGQLLLSACAGVPIATLAAAAPGAQIIRLMPILAAQYGASPTLVHPMQPALKPLLDAWGSTITIDDEAQFETATTSAAIFGWVQALIGASADWSTENGLPQAQARRLQAETFRAAAIMLRENEAPVPELLDSIATPGGITEAGLSHLRGAGVEVAWREACALVLRRLRGSSKMNPG